jgi:metallo-beta-lactamase class B
MKPLVIPILLVLLGQGTLRPDPPKECDACPGWNAPREPFRIFGQTYFVGVADLSSLLIASDKGLILIDGGLPQSAPLIDANIRTLGFKSENIRLIVNSHPHFDHAGGIAALQRLSGATVAASPAGARALEQGLPTPDDPQYRLGPAFMSFPPVKNVKLVTDGEVLRVGDLAITVHFTPGHTPGGTSWSWRSCEGDRCLNFVYADSLTPVAAPDFRYTANGGGAVDTFRRSIAKIGELPCDVVISAHPGFTDMDGKLKQRAARTGTDPFVDPGGCRAYAAEASKRLDARVAEERKAPAKSGPGLER